MREIVIDAGILVGALAPGECFHAEHMAHYEGILWRMGCEPNAPGRVRLRYRNRLAVEMAHELGCKFGLWAMFRLWLAEKLWS